MWINVVCDSLILTLDAKNISNNILDDRIVYGGGFNIHPPFWFIRSLARMEGSSFWRILFICLILKICWNARIWVILLVNIVTYETFNIYFLLSCMSSTMFCWDNGTFTFWNFLKIVHFMYTETHTHSSIDIKILICILRQMCCGSRRFRSLSFFLPLFQF